MLFKTIRQSFFAFQFKFPELNVRLGFSKTKMHNCVISGFCLEVAEDLALLGHHAASSGNFVSDS
jgi:hypothetical protein